MTILTIVAMMILVSPKIVLAPVMPERPEVSVPATSISRGEPTQRIERRVMRVTAYTARDKGMNGKGITASGEKALEGRTLAADQGIPFGSQIYIPALNRTYIVIDRGGAIHGDRLDLYMESRKDAMKFGVQELEVFIKYPRL